MDLTRVIRLSWKQPPCRSAIYLQKVSSLVTPDTIVVSRTSEKITSYETADKQLMTIRTEKGTKEVPVADPMRQKPALTDNQVQVLTKLGKTIEQYYQMPMDVEWALEKNQMYIVQARPITVLPPEWKPLEKGVIYTKSSLAEHLPCPVTPLFATLGMNLINQARQFSSAVPPSMISDELGTVMIHGK